MAKPKAQTLQQRFGFLDDDLKTPKHDEIMLWLDENCVSIVEELFWTSDWDKEVITTWINRVDIAISFAKEKANEKIIQNQKDLKKDEKENDNPAEYWERWRQGKRDSISATKLFLSQLSEWPGLVHPPSKPNLETATYNTVWEKPVTSNNYKSTYTIGFIDFVYHFHDYSLSVKNLAYNRPNEWSDKREWLLDKSIFPEWEIQPSKDHAIFFEVKSTIPSLGELIRQVQMYRQHTGGNFVIVSPDDRLAIPLKKQNIHFYKYPF